MQQESEPEIYGMRAVKWVERKTILPPSQSSQPLFIRAQSETMGRRSLLLKIVFFLLSSFLTSS